MITTAPILLTRREPLSNQNQNLAAPLPPDHSYHPQINGTSTSASSNDFQSTHSSQNPGVTLATAVTNGAHNIPSCVQMRHQTSASSNLSVPVSRFSRDVNRHSMQFAMDGKWADAADRYVTE